MSLNVPVKKPKPNDGWKVGPMKHPWLRKLSDIKADTPSRSDGVAYTQEMSLKQDGCDFMHDVLEKLIFQIPKKGNKELEACKTLFHSILCTAAVFFHRFFSVQSVNRFNVLHVATVCLFVASKSLAYRMSLNVFSYILFVHKYSRIPKEAEKDDMRDILILLEQSVIQTLGFDFNVVLPHSFVLNIIKDLEKQSNVNCKSTAKKAYFLATEIILVTDWSIRYAPQDIAVACVELAIDPEFRSHFVQELDDIYFATKISLNYEELRGMVSEVRENRLFDLSKLEEGSHFTFKRQINIKLAPRVLKLVRQVI
ncbi:unnamed protein product [Caenorhabditis brenneri]